MSMMRKAAQKAIFESKLTRTEIARRLGWPKQRITGVMGMDPDGTAHMNRCERILELLDPDALEGLR